MNSAHLLSLLFIPIGVLFMIKNKFWKYDSGSMIYPATLKLFLGGIIFLMIGLYGIVDGAIKLIK